MDLSQTLSALLAIVMIDIVLAGDNAIVIALAARSLPEHLKRRAILWGAAGAIVVRSLMTVIVVWLLQIPGLLLAGGAMLVWIGYRLLLPDAGNEHAGKPAATTFWTAIRTIVVADAVMGLDNVLAVAGAAHGSYALVIAGLVISVPIVVWGSTLVLKLVDRFPAVVYLGAAVLVWTAVKMILGEPFVKPWIEAAPALRVALFGMIPLVLWVGFVKNHRRFESRIRARLAEHALRHPKGQGQVAPAPASTSQPPGDRAMLRVLVPVDGSANALRAVRHVVAEYRRHHELEVHLVNVQPHLSRHIARFLSRHDCEAWHREQAEVAMASARPVLDQATVPYQTHWAVGDRAVEICAAAKRLEAHHIVIGTARQNSLTRMLEASVTSRVLETTQVPVEVVVGDSVSKWDRWGWPAGVAGALLYLAID